MTVQYCTVMSRVMCLGTKKDRVLCLQVGTDYSTAYFCEQSTSSGVMSQEFIERPAH